jgi:hypothetical protein
VQIQSDDHFSLFSNAELELVQQWIAAGAPEQ